MAVWTGGPESGGVCWLFCPTPPPRSSSPTPTSLYHCSRYCFCRSVSLLKKGIICQMVFPLQSPGSICGCLDRQLWKWRSLLQVVPPPPPHLPPPPTAPLLHPDSLYHCSRYCCSCRSVSLFKNGIIYVKWCFLRRVRAVFLLNCPFALWTASLA